MVEPPVFSRKPSPVDMLRGTEVSLECEISGTPPFDVTWYKDKRQIRSSKKYKVTAKNYHTSIRILNVEVADVGEYQCKAQNDVGSDTCFCTVKLKGKILAFCSAPNGSALLSFYVGTVFTTTASFLSRTTEIRDKNKQRDCCGW